MNLLRAALLPFSLALFSVASVVNAEMRPNIAMMEYNQIFDKSGRSLDIVLERKAADWHCETVTSDGVGHNCTLKTAEKKEDNVASNRLIKVLSYVGPVDVNDPLYLTGTEEYLKDWECDWVDSSGVGHDCDWIDIIILEE